MRLLLAAILFASTASGVITFDLREESTPFPLITSGHVEVYPWNPGYPVPGVDAEWYGNQIWFDPTTLDAPSYSADLKIGSAEPFVGVEVLNLIPVVNTNIVVFTLNDEWNGEASLFGYGHPRWDAPPGWKISDKIGATVRFAFYVNPNDFEAYYTFTSGFALMPKNATEVMIGPWVPPQNGNNVNWSLTHAAVPEPGVMGLLASAMLLRARRGWR